MSTDTHENLVDMPHTLWYHHPRGAWRARKAIHQRTTYMPDPQVLAISAPALCIFAAQSYGCLIEGFQCNTGFVTMEWYVVNAPSFYMRMH